MEPNVQEPMKKVKIINLLIRYKNAFLTLWPLVIVLAILGGLISTYRAKSSFVPMYTSKAIFTVESGAPSDDIFSAGAYYDQYAAQQLASTFPHILSTDMMKDLVTVYLGKGYVNASVRAEAVANSNILVLTTYSNNAQDAYDCLCAVIECYPQVAENMMDNPRVKIMDPPSMTGEPYNSFSPITSAIKGLTIGALAGLLIIFACAFLTRTIQTADELKSTINLPIIIALPKITIKKRRSANTNALITAESDLNMAESLRGLRVKVKKMLDSPEKKTILVTSTLAGEGKTTVAINLALSLVKDGHKVLLLDGDLRNQSIARTLGDKSGGTGLMDCLKNPQLSILDCVRTLEGSALNYISGSSTDKRHYAIDHKAMRRVLATLAENFDYVVIDTAPTEVVSDTTALCRHADCVLYVVRQDYAQKGQVLNSVSALHEKDVKIAGCIFNGVPQFHRQYGYGYRSTYGYGYDYGYRKYSYGSKYGYGYGYASKYAKSKSGSKSES